MHSLALPRPLFVLVLAMILVTVGAAAGKPATPAGELPAQGCGGHLTAGPATAPSVRWRYGVEGGFASPLAVHDDAIYVAAAGLVALDPEAGDERWGAFPGSRSHWAEPTGDTVFVAMDEQIAAVDRATGQERWRAAVGGSPTAAPALGTSIIAIGTSDGDIAGFDHVTGAERWRYSRGGWVASGPSVVADIVYAGYAGEEQGIVIALGATDGHERWRATLGDDLAATPAVADQTVVVVGRNGVYALDTATGKERWRVDTEFNRYAFPTTPVIVGDTVYVGAGDGALHALDAGTGADRWESESPALPGYVGSELHMVGDSIVVATQLGGSIAAVDAETGQLRWSYPPSGTEVWPAVVPAPAGAAIYVTVGDDLAALDAETGEARWCITLDSFADQLLAGDEAVYIGTDSAGLIAVVTDPVPAKPDVTPARPAPRTGGSTAAVVQSQAQHCSRGVGAAPATAQIGRGLGCGGVHRSALSEDSGSRASHLVATSETGAGQIGSRRRS